MRKKKGGVEIPETLDLVAQDEAGDTTGKGGDGFFACYLLTSLSPRHKGHTYIGFTVNPRRRIRQHNGEITSGAWRTKSKRPWEMVLCIYGFPTNISALQFEWAWQHPRESLAVREAAAAFKSFSGVANKIKLAYAMLNLPAWKSLSITVNYFSTKYTHHRAFCPSLPEHIKVQVCSMDELPCFTKTDNSPSGNEHDLDAEEEDDDHIEYNQSMHGNTTDAPNGNCSRSDLLSTADDEYRDKEYELAEEPETVVDDSLAKVTSFCVEETAEKANLLAFTLWDTNEPETRAGKATVRDGSRNRLSMSDEEVEVIDLLTPSPSCRMRSLSKKRRVAEIIDLTKSPNFIQL